MSREAILVLADGSGAVAGRIEDDFDFIHASIRTGSGELTGPWKASHGTLIDSLGRILHFPDGHHPGWEAGIMAVHDEDLDAVYEARKAAGLSPITCNACDLAYTGEGYYLDDWPNPS